MPPVFSKELKEKYIAAGGLDDQRRTSPCESVCPAGNPIQKMHGLIESGRVEEALEFIHSRNPFPSVTGRICPHPCEEACNRNQFDQGVSIRALERFAADRADPAMMKQPQKRPATGRKIAVVGAGPAGLTCAYFSALFGHEVTVFEAEPVMGGIPRVAAPDFRLPKDVVDKEIGAILAAGIRVRTNVRVGRDISLDTLRSEFDACLIAAGAGRERTLNLPGGEYARPAVKWLKEVNLAHDRQAPGKRVAVIGGGGVAFDAAFTARRLGAEAVYIVCLEDQGACCVPAAEVSQARTEGIVIMHGCSPQEILVRDGCVTGLALEQVCAFQFDEKGELQIEYVENGASTLDVDAVIAAIGIQVDMTPFGGADVFELTPRGAMKVNPQSLATSVPGVFAAGDAAFGPSIVAQAVGSGRKAAAAIDRYLGGQDPAGETLIRLDDREKVDITAIPYEAPAYVVPFDELMNVESIDSSPRRETTALPRARSNGSFEEIDLGLRPEDAVAEAARCFHCGHCIACGACVDDCPGHILAMTEDGPRVAWPDECWHCGCCRTNCPRGAIFYKFPLSMML